MTNKKSKLPRKFCENQIVCSDVPDVYTCMGHMAEGRAFTCCYDESQISVVRSPFGNRRYKFEIKRKTQGGDGVCRDFDITDEIKSELIKKLLSDLEES